MSRKKSTLHWEKKWHQKKRFLLLKNLLVFPVFLLFTPLQPDDPDDSDGPDDVSLTFFLLTNEEKERKDSSTSVQEMLCTWL